jgi:hypothetical protein
LSKYSSSSARAVPDVAPVSRMPFLCAFLFSNFHAQCAATMLPGSGNFSNLENFPRLV